MSGNIEKIPLYYEEFGSGEPLLLLHGNGEDHTVFARQIEYFAPHFRVIAVDSRGHGKSARGTEKLTYEAMAGDVELLLETLKIKECRIIGFSDGGIIALLLAASIPHKIKQMILIGANYRPSGLKFSVRAAVFFSFLCYSIGFWSEKWCWKRQLMKLMLCQPTISEKLLSKIDTDTLQIIGEHDMIRIQHVNRIKELIKGSKLEILLNCNHFVLQQQPELFNQAAIKFFKI